MFNNNYRNFFAIIFLIVNILFNIEVANSQTVLDRLHLFPESGNSFGPNAIGINPETNRIYIRNFGSGDISVVDGDTNKVIDTITILDSKNCRTDGISINSVTNRIYVSSNICAQGDQTETANFISVIDGFTNKVIDTIEREDKADENLIAVDSNTNLLYVISFDTIIVVNGLTNEIIKTIDVKAKAIGINSSNHKIYIAADGDVKVIDDTNHQVVGTIDLDANAIGVNQITGNIYLATGTSLKVIDVKTNSIIDSIDIIANSIEINQATNVVYAGSEKTISIINGFDNKLIGTIEINAASIKVNSQTGMLYAISGTDVFIIDGNSGEIINFITLGALPEDIKVNDETKRVYIIDKFNSKLLAVDQEELRIIDTVALNGIPSSFGINKTTNKIYVALAQDNIVQVIDGNNNTIIKNMNVGTDPNDIWVDSVNNLIYTANSLSSNISVIDGNTDEVVENIGVNGNPVFIAGNNNTNRIYVAAGGANITVINGKSNTVVDFVEIGHRAGQIAVNTDTNLVYVTNASNDDKRGIVIGSVINGLTNKALNTFTINNQNIDRSMGERLKQNGIAINVELNHVYISSVVLGELPHGVIGAASGKISIIDGLSNEVVNIFNLEDPQSGIAINQENNIIYFTNKLDGDLIVVNGMPGALPSPNITTLKVEPEFAKSSVRFQDAIVAVTGRFGRPISGVTVTASANGRLTSVSPTSAMTSVDGKAGFKFRFGILTKDGSITFRAGNKKIMLFQE